MHLIEGKVAFSHTLSQTIDIIRFQAITSYFLDNNIMTTAMQLKVPYFSQLNNSTLYGYQPYQQCNVTALGMCAAFFLDSQAKDDHGWEERLLKAVVASGGIPYDPYCLERAFNSEFPTLRDDFVPNASIDEICRSLNVGNPCVVHGYFTRSGHIVTVVGYDMDTLIIHDPYGEWLPDGYSVNGPPGSQVKGKSNIFYQSTINELCNFDGIWTHFVSKPH